MGNQLSPHHAINDYTPNQLIEPKVQKKTSKLKHKDGNSSTKKIIYSSNSE